jgi:neutral ceramidase
MKAGLLFLASLVSCGDKPAPDRDPIYLSSGSPLAGVAEIDIDFPMGAPMGGYSNRCDYLGRHGAVDQRRSAYTIAWSSSAGIQTRSRAQVLWLNNGDQDLVLIKADVIYSFDKLVRDIEYQLSQATGRDLAGRVVVTTSHTHHAPANFSDSYHFYLGGDRYNEEVFQRFRQSLVDAALEAWDTKEPAAIGMSMTEDWDPEDKVYSDRRSENDELKVWDDHSPGKKKDPLLWLLRVDTASGDPMGAFFNFGIHGTVLGADNAMVSTDASGHVEYALAERFDTPIVLSLWQGSGGDQSPRGTDDGFARLETIGEYAADAIYALWEATPTSSNPIMLETITHSIPEGLEEISVNRPMEESLHYLRYSTTREADLLIYNEDGSIRSPLDEFNAQYGGAFCGYEDPLISVGTIGTDVFPYDACMDVELMSWVIAGVFKLEADSVPVPLPSSTAAMTTAARIGPIDILQPGGDTEHDNAYLSFFPGETTQMFNEQYARRAEAELGLSNVFPVGYAQDHEGYLLIPEDWLVGGYEPNINIWGPLQAEHIMEGNLDMMASHLLTNRLEPQDAGDAFPDTRYPSRALPTAPLDTTPEAGTTPTEVPEGLWSPLGLTIQLQPDPIISRVQGTAQMVWEGGDPAVDLPRVELEILDGETWLPVQTQAGRTVSDTLPDILTAHTPDPLYPYDANQRHTWWAGWQAVSHSGIRTALPMGTYRLHVYGHTAGGERTEWPYDSAEYEVTSTPFVVEAAVISVSLDVDGIWAHIQAPAHGYRLIDLEGSSIGANPVHEASLSWTLSDGTIVEDDIEGEQVDGRTLFSTTPPEGAVSVSITDPDGNHGSASLE